MDRVRLKIGKKTIEYGVEIDQHGFPKIFDKNGKILTQWSDSNGYIVANAGNRRDPASVKIHRIVGAWLLSKNETLRRKYENTDWVVHHIDHNPTNNNIENLMVVSPQEHIILHKRRLTSTKRKISESMRAKGIKRSAETKRKISEAMKHIIRSEDHKKRLSEAIKLYWKRKKSQIV